MKKNLLYLLLVCSTVINAQKYVPFPTENAMWNIFYASAYNQIKIDTTLHKYILQGDTTINGISYHKLCKVTGTDAKPQFEFTGGLREHDKKIYLYGYGYLSNKEYLLYDFNKKTGDSVMFDQKRWYKIINTDSVKIGSDFRKRFEIVIMHSNTSEFIIEGIGDVTQGLLGMITPIPTCMDCFFKLEFVSFNQNGECVYKNPNFVDCGSTRKWSDMAYVQFPTEKAIWSELKFYQGQCDYPNYCKYQYKILGDTLINTTLYHKVYEQNDTLAGNANAFYYGAMREQNKKVYFCYKDCNSDVCLYDFSKNIGDTLQIQLGSCNYNYIDNAVVRGIDTVMIDGKYRKRFHINTIMGESLWIEGIGSTNGLFYPVIPPLSCICSWNLVCFHQNNSAVFVNKNNALCYLTPNITCFPSTIDGVNTPTEKKSFIVSPNPVKDILIVQFTSENVTGTTMEIINVLGKRVKTISISNSSEYKLNLTDCSAGIYNVMLKYKNKTESQKIIKM